MEPLKDAPQAGPARTGEERLETELAVLQRYGLRWAVLVAWTDELQGWKISLPPEVGKKLEEARIKISSGCFLICSVGCILGAVEAALVSTATSSGVELAEKAVDFWMELLAHAMSDADAAGRLLKVPAVKFHYAKCGFGPCQCGS